LQLQSLGILDSGVHPQIPKKTPAYDDPEPLGVSFFRQLIESVDLSNLSLPRTFFGRSEFRKVSFENSELSESNLCWNDFIEVKFSHASLKQADVRASNFRLVRFDRADLSGADLRRSVFESCTFRGANLTGCVFTLNQRRSLSLSKAQEAQVVWKAEVGKEPGGG
jgi:BTB/POZ domain-containing protein KCTD9